jgi:Peptidase family S41/PDZ domain
MRSFIFLLLLIGIPLPSYAQLSPRQKADDFLTIVTLYDRLYAPLPLVTQESGFNPLHARPWVERAKATASDAEFYQLCRRYLARFGNTQDTLNLTPGTLFGATLGFTINYYSNTLLIDSIDRDTLPETQYPFQIGDQLLSVDHRSIDQWLDALIPLVAAVNPDLRRSLAANLIVNRKNPMLPFTPQPGDMATITVRRQNGRVEDYSVKWVVQGAAVAEFGPLRAQAPPPAPPSPLANVLANRHVPSGALPALGVGALQPIFQLPDDFQQHLGASPSDAFFSGIYQADGYRIGFLRIGTFLLQNPRAAIQQLDEEVQYLGQNTDGLILDLMRNDGGNANYQDQVAQRFFHTTFKTLAERIRPTQSVVQAAADALAAALRANPPDQDLIDHLRQVYDELNSAYTHGQRLTSPLLLRNTTALLGPARDQAGNVIAYSKPILLLVDENTGCGAEAFAAVFQDNQRGPIAGKRTQGAGGALELTPGGFFSEATLTITRTLFVREQPGSGKLSYIQNAGVTPDIFLDFMTRGNLTGGGRAFVRGFTRSMVNYLRTSSHQ